MTTGMKYVLRITQGSDVWVYDNEYRSLGYQRASQYTDASEVQRGVRVA